MRPAGRLRFRVRFERQVPVKDPDGGTLSPWTEQFTRSADIIPQRGGETVQGQRLQGQQPLILIVRRDSKTQCIDTSWRAVEMRNGVALRTLGIKTAEDMERDGQFITMQVVAGDPDGGQLGG